MLDNWLENILCSFEVDCTKNGGNINTHIASFRKKSFKNVEKIHINYGYI